MAGAWRERAAGLMCVGFKERSLDDQTRVLLDEGVAGVLLCGRKLANPEEVAGLVHSIKRYAGRRVFVAIDHEGGERCVLSGNFTALPEMRELGETGDEELARSVGRVLGRELRSVGVDVTLGPVLDIVSNPLSPVARERALGTEPGLVARLGAALIEGQQSEGVAALGKHFPGHGDTRVDSNFELPILPHGVARLEEVELRPFVAAISARMAGLMVGHILFPALDEVHPASLSRPIIVGLLRQKMGYRGMLMTDDVDMGALTGRFSKEEIAVQGIAAGIDCFLCARTPSSAFELMDAIEDGVETGTVLPERVESARRRMTPLLHRYAQDPGESPDLSAFVHETPAAVLPLIRETN